MAAVSRGLRRLTSTADLQRLTKWVQDTQHPASFRVVGHLRSNVLGILKNEVIVNAWPRPSVVVLKPPPETSPGYVNNVCSVFATDMADCKDTLMDDRVMDWEKPWGIGGLDDRLTGAIADIAELNGGKLEGHSGPCVLAHITEERLKDVKADLPEGYYSSKLREMHISLITATWPYREEDTDNFLNYLLKNLPTTCVRIAGTGQMVGWTIAQHYRCIGMMYILPKHRHKGIGQYMTKVAAQDLIKSGSPAYTYTLKNNTPALNMLKDMGFEAVKDFDAVWVTYHPPAEQMRMVRSG